MIRVISPASPAADLPARFARLADAEYWRRLVPGLHIAAAENNALEKQRLSFTPQVSAEVNELLVKEGYFHLPPQNWDVPVAGVTEGVQRVVAAGYMPIFSFMFDELWTMYFQLDELLTAVLGAGYALLPNFWAWHVDSAAGESGWQPHRDMGYRSLYADRRPKTMTVWLPLTAATPVNSCIYVVPADRDPHYATPGDNTLQAELQNIRALPSLPGSVLGWTQGLIHWGSRPAARATEPRISASFEFQRGDEAPFNQPLLKPGVYPSPETRLRLILRQLLQYQHMYALNPDLHAVAQAYGRLGAAH